MSPRLAITNLRNPAAAHSKPFNKVLDGDTRFPGRTHFLNLGFRELCVARACPVAGVLPAFRDHVADVVLIGRQVGMSWVAADWVVAAMGHLETPRRAVVGDRERHTMSKKGYGLTIPLHTEKPIPLWKTGTNERPAGIRTPRPINALDEPGDFRNAKTA